MAVSLRRQHPNLMLRVMRTMRLMQIECTPWRLRYIKLYCAVRIMEPPHAVALGARPTLHCAIVMQDIIRDYWHGPRANGRALVSERLQAQIEELEMKLRVIVGA